MSIPTIGMPWFEPSSYKKLLLLVEDPSELPASYNDWLQRAIRQHESMRVCGFDVVLVSVDVDDFVDWCSENNCKPSAATKRRYADYLFKSCATIRCGPHWVDVRRHREIGV